MIFDAIVKNPSPALNLRTSLIQTFRRIVVELSPARDALLGQCDGWDARPLAALGLFGSQSVIRALLGVPRPRRPQGVRMVSPELDMSAWARARHSAFEAT